MSYLIFKYVCQVSSSDIYKNLYYLDKNLCLSPRTRRPEALTHARARGPHRPHLAAAARASRLTVVSFSAQRSRDAVGALVLKRLLPRQDLLHAHRAEPFGEGVITRMSCARPIGADRKPLEVSRVDRAMLARVNCLSV